MLASGMQMPAIFKTGQDRTAMEVRAMRLGGSALLWKRLDEEPCRAQFAPP